MADWSKRAITNLGKAMLAESQALGIPINITYCKTSSHNYFNDDLEQLTDLTDIEQSILISEKTVKNDTIIKLTANLTNDQLLNGYNLYTYGVYTNLNGGSDVLFMVAANDAPDPVPPVSSSRWQTLLNSNIEVSNIDNIKITIDYAANATQQWVNENKLINITYNALKTLRDGNNLIPGQQYRITDFTTIINGDVTVSGVTKTLYRSANHPFDIIVTADSSNTLNENARAIQHEGDTYFASSNLRAWQLKYCLDNDTTRFTWAINSGKGVIFYLKDERGNECGYDFKNIQMKRFKITAVDLTSLDVFETGTINTKYKANCIDYLVGTYLGTIKASDLLPVRDDIITINESDFKWIYTFNKTTNDFVSCEDASLVYANDNSIKNRFSRLNNIAFVNKSNGITGVHIDTDGLDSSFGNYIFGVNIDYGFQNNIIGNNCYLNNIKENYKNNIMIDNCTHNFINGNNSNNIMLYSSVNNTYGYYNQNNIWSLDGSVIGNQNAYIQTGEDCDNWFMGNGNAYIQTGDNCENSFFGNACGGSVANAIKMGNECKGNFFKGYNRTITLGNKIEMCEFGKYSRTISMPNTSTNIYGGIVIPSSCANKTFNQGCNYIVLANSDISTRTYTTADNNKTVVNPTATNVSIPTTGWTFNSTTQDYSQTITVPGMYAEYQGAKDADFVRPPRNASYLTNLETIREQMDNITDIISNNGSITVYIKEVPTLAFQITLYGL